jgi:hypothetical protein
MENLAFASAFPIAPSEVGTAGLAWLALKLLPDWKLASSIADSTAREQHGNIVTRGW